MRTCRPPAIMKLAALLFLVAGLLIGRAGPYLIGDTFSGIALAFPWLGNLSLSLSGPAFFRVAGLVLVITALVLLLARRCDKKKRSEVSTIG